jgi:hypothetical protein
MLCLVKKLSTSRLVDCESFVIIQHVSNIKTKIGENPSLTGIGGIYPFGYDPIAKVFRVKSIKKTLALVISFGIPTYLVISKSTSPIHIINIILSRAHHTDRWI